MQKKAKKIFVSSEKKPYLCIRYPENNLFTLKKTNTYWRFGAVTCEGHRFFLLKPFSVFGISRMVSKEYRDSRSLVEISYVIYKAFIFFATYKTIPYFNCLPSSCLKQYWATSLLSFSLFSILVMSFITKYTPSRKSNSNSFYYIYFISE